MLSTVDLALQIAITVFEAEAKEKRNLAVFQSLKPQEKLAANLVSPGKALEDQSADRVLVLAQTRRM